MAQTLGPKRLSSAAGVVVALLAAMLTLAVTPTPAGAPPSWHTDMLTRVNAVRAAHGAPPLILCANLTNAAQGHAEYMAATGNFSHTGAGGTTIGQRAQAAGYHFSAIAENIAAGQASVAAVMSAWTTSGGHLANMTNPAYRHLGLGWSGIYWVQTLGAGGSCGNPAIGALDSVTAPAAAQVRVSGWALSPNSPTTALTVRVNVDGTRVGTLVANRSRPDIASAYPGAGPNHGYAGTFPAAYGTRRVCVVAVNVGGGPPTSPLGCRDVFVPDPLSPFIDVTRDDLFFAAIVALNDAGVITGYPDGSFGPTRAVTRQAAAAYLHRLAGQPPVQLAAPFFADVGPGDPFYTPIQWMAQAGISQGDTNPSGGKPLFRPTREVARQAAAAFLHRYAGSPAPSLNSPFFADVGRTHPFFVPVQWMAQRGLALGTPVPGGVRYEPSKVVSRQAMVGFLHRL